MFDTLLNSDIPRHELLLALAERYNCPFTEYDEDLLISPEIMARVDAQSLKQKHWMPVSIVGDRARVIATYPDQPGLVEDIRSTLGVDKVEFRVALPEDIVRIIENNQDLNPGFPPEAGRTPLARTRTFLADVRSSLSLQRTAMAKGRTGLAFLRTGIACITAGVGLLRLFGARYFLPVDIMLIIAGIASIADGLRWFVPARREALKPIVYNPRRRQPGTTVLATYREGDSPEFIPSAPVKGAAGLRGHWHRLSPVQRRRFYANDRTDMAEERTSMASLRNAMAKTRTGLAFARSGVAFAGLGLGLMTKFPSSGWLWFDLLLIASGSLMTIEGFRWYLPGYRAGRHGINRFRDALSARNIWDFVFPQMAGSRRLMPPVNAAQAPGIWGTTGLALERTVLAERRNQMSRLRTVMAYSRTGMAYVRTGLSVVAVAVVLFLLVNAGAPLEALAVLLGVAGLVLVADGLRWCLQSDRLRKEYPFCGGDIEICRPNYGVPGRYWGRIAFSDES